MRYCVAFTACWGLSVWQLTFALASNTNTTPIFEAKFNWDKDESILNNSIITTAAIVGMTIGSFLGGAIVPKGRRKTVIIGQLLCALSSIIAMYENTVTLSIARLILGTGAGMMNVTFGKMITETIPVQLVSSFSMLHNGSVCIGFILCFGLAALLPDPKDIEANKEDELWRAIWLAPAVIAFFEILLVLLVFRLETVGYCLMEGRDEEALKHLSKVYRKKEGASNRSIEDLLEAHYRFLKNTTTQDATTTTFNDAICGRKYRKAAWICAIINLFNQWSGINAINVYANRLLTMIAESEGGADFPITPIQGTYIIGIANTIGANIPILYAGKVGRRPVFILG